MMRGGLNNERGVALVITLLVVALITAMVVEFAYGVYVSTSSLHNWQTSQKLSVAARSATKLAGRLIASGMLEKTKDSWTIVQEIPYKDPEGTITVLIEPSTARFNINWWAGSGGMFDTVNGYPVLRRLMKALELNPDLADRIIWWINPKAMLALGPPESAKGAPLDSIDELLLIPGVDQASYDKLKRYVTITGSGKIDINTADVPVLMSLSDKINIQVANRIVGERELKPFGSLSELGNRISDLRDVAIGLGSVAYANPSIISSFHVRITAESAGIKRVIETVLDGGTIKFWRES